MSTAILAGALLGEFAVWVIVAGILGSFIEPVTFVWIMLYGVFLVPVFGGALGWWLAQRSTAKRSQP
jgi:hypothetical protein